MSFGQNFGIVIQCFAGIWFYKTMPFEEIDVGAVTQSFVMKSRWKFPF